MQNAAEIGSYTMGCLRKIMETHEYIGDVRGLGLMIGMEFVEDRLTKEPHEKLRDLIIDQAFQRGLLLLGCGKSTIRFAPPLSVSRDETDEALSIFTEALEAAEAELIALAS
jgi:4-aminobutyrate aminotransferase